MSKPNIIKILDSRNIGMNKDYEIIRYIGLDDKGVKWDYLGHVSRKSSKVIDTFDYREVK